ncbi:hypothetical protein [Paenibacillus campi]|uniref:hypothetical protein n=1 Tax=Paenibacillus campi TaxID=3106031 RepID=UPI002AFFEB18|nr:hypothetical protein [Paenibacillus sp. SGZ-1014]
MIITIAIAIHCNEKPLVGLPQILKYDSQEFITNARVKGCTFNREMHVKKIAIITRLKKQLFKILKINIAQTYKIIRVMDKMHNILNPLQLAFPPISEQEADWLWNDTQVHEIVKEPKLYVIGHRKELFFVNFKFETATENTLTFQIKMGDIISPLITYSVHSALAHLIKDNDEVDFELTSKLIKITLNDPGNVIQWFTPDSFLFLQWRKRIKVTSHDAFDFRQFTNFKLYYVGISQKGDRFSNLFDQARDEGLEAMHNTGTKNQDVRYDNDLTIFLFDIVKISENILETEDRLEQKMMDASDKEVLMHAKKAFIKLLKKEDIEGAYQTISQITEEIDNEQLLYSYSLQEDISFCAEHMNFEGHFSLLTRDEFISVQEGNGKSL